MCRKRRKRNETLELSQICKPQACGSHRAKESEANRHFPTEKCQGAGSLEGRSPRATTEADASVAIAVAAGVAAAAAAGAAAGGGAGGAAAARCLLRLATAAAL